MSDVLFKNVIYKQLVYKSYIFNNKQDVALNNEQRLICYKIQRTKHISDFKFG